MAYWRRNSRQMQAATDQVAVAPSSPAAEKPKSPRSRMMRQYDLVERVRSYNPDTNEDLLNRAYVYAMKAHGEQVRASGDPYFSHPLEVAAILTCLVPAQLLAVWTRRDSHVLRRAALQAVAFAGLVLGVLSSVILQQSGGSWLVLTARPDWLTGILLQLLLVPALLGPEAGLIGAGPSPPRSNRAPRPASPTRDTICCLTTS